MRNKNYEKLQNAYNMSLIVKESKKIDEFSEEIEQKAQNSEKKPEFFKALFTDSDKDAQMTEIKIKSETKITDGNDKNDIFSGDRPKSSRTLLKYKPGKQVENQEQMREEKESENNSRSRKSSETSCSLQIL